MSIILLLISPFLFVFCSPVQHPFATVPSDLDTYSSPAYPEVLSSGYFKAKGAEASWSLSISDDKIAFESTLAGVDMFTAPHTEPVRAADANVKIYRLQTEAGQMEIRITHRACQLSHSNEGFSYEVEVSIKRSMDSTYTVFDGCGTYVTDDHLQATWVLEQIKDKPVTGTDFSDKVPTLEIKANGNSFSGYAGCNQISGRLFSERSLLRFTDVVSTQTACDASSLEASFLQALSFSTQFQIEDNRLTLSNPGGTMLILRRTD